MKVLIPYTTHFKLQGKQDGVVTGGIEKFCYNIFDNFDEAIPLSITTEIKESRRTKQVIQDAINKHKPDMIWFNNPWWGRMMLSFNIPLILVVHEPLVRDIRFVDFGKILKELNENGTHIYFVSPNQYYYHVKLAKRINNTDFGSIKGYINSSYLPEDMPFVEEHIWDVITVGSQDPMKSPFTVKKKLEKSKLVSAVITNDAVYKSPTINKYIEDNKHWDYVIRGATHDKVIQNVASSRVFVSTCTHESWGITAMEALGCGVPVLVCTDKSGVHSSLSLAADPLHMMKVERSVPNNVFEECIEALYKITKRHRKDIQEQSIKKHHLNNWRKSIDDMINKRIDDKIKYNNLEKFM